MAALRKLYIAKKFCDLKGEWRFDLPSAIRLYFELGIHDSYFHKTPGDWSKWFRLQALLIQVKAFLTSMILGTQGSVVMKRKFADLLVGGSPDIMCFSGGETKPTDLILPFPSYLFKTNSVGLQHKSYSSLRTEIGSPLRDPKILSLPLTVSHKNLFLR